MLQPGEKILWEKSKASGKDTLWAILRPFLTVLFWNVVYWVSGIAVGAYAYYFPANPYSQDPILNFLYIIALYKQFYPFVAVLAFIALIIMIIGNLVGLSRELILTDQRILRKGRVITRSEIQNVVYARRNRLFFAYGTGKKVKYANIQLKKKDYETFLLAYRDVQQGSDL
jgi:hypothetical protein